MTDVPEQIPPDDLPSENPKWMQFPKMSVNADHIPLSWMVTHGTGVVWVWVRSPVGVNATPFSVENGAQFLQVFSEKLKAAIELQINANRLLEVRAPIYGPNGEVIG